MHQGRPAFPGAPPADRGTRSRGVRPRPGAAGRCREPARRQDGAVDGPVHDAGELGVEGNVLVSPGALGRTRRDFRRDLGVVGSALGGSGDAGSASRAPTTARSAGRWAAPRPRAYYSPERPRWGRGGRRAPQAAITDGRGIGTGARGARWQDAHPAHSIERRVAHQEVYRRCFLGRKADERRIDRTRRGSASGASTCSGGPSATMQPSSSTSRGKKCTEGVEHGQDRGAVASSLRSTSRSIVPSLVAQVGGAVGSSSARSSVAWASEPARSAPTDARRATTRARRARGDVQRRLARWLPESPRGPRDALAELRGQPPSPTTSSTRVANGRPAAGRRRAAGHLEPVELADEHPAELGAGRTRRPAGYRRSVDLPARSRPMARARRARSRDRPGRARPGRDTWVTSGQRGATAGGATPRTPPGQE